MTGCGVPLPIETYCDRIIRQLQAIPGMTDAPYRGFESSQLWAYLPEGLNLRIWQNRLGVHHVFLANRTGTACLQALLAGPTRMPFMKSLCSYENYRAL